MKYVLLFWLIIVNGLANFAHADTLIGGTVYFEPEIVNSSDPSQYVGSVFVRDVRKTIYDERVEDDKTRMFYEFQWRFRDAARISIFVSQEFGPQERAKDAADRYGIVFGRMLLLLRDGVEQVNFYPTGDDWYASPGEITIHDGAYKNEAADGALEESMMHECVHATQDFKFEETPDWIAAQHADDAFVSDYAKSNPAREDFAETFVLFYGLDIKPNRLHVEDRKAIEALIPNRLAFMRAIYPKHTLK